MKRMICYFLLCALVLGLIAGCISQPPETTQPSDPASMDGTPGNQGTQETLRPGFTVPTYDLEPLPTASRDPIGTVPGVEQDQEIYILTGKNNITYAIGEANNSYGFYIYAKKPLNTESISVELPISSGYTLFISEVELNGIQNVGGVNRIDERSYNEFAFSYPLYLAYRGKDFEKMADLHNKVNQLRELTDRYTEQWLNGELSDEEYDLLRKPFYDALQEFEDYSNAEWDDYLALSKQDLPQFYVYSVFVAFFSKDFQKEESFTQIEVTIEDQVYVQDVGNISLIWDWELPAPLDWTTADQATDGILGSANAPAVYCDGIHYINTYFHFYADQYKLLKEVKLLDPNQQIDRVWLNVRPKNGGSYVVEWDMSEPYEVYPGDDVVVYLTYRDDGLKTPGYHTMTDGYLLYTADGQDYCKFSHCSIDIRQQHYIWYAILFDGVDFESYYWDYYYHFYEPWRFDPEEDPVWYD